MRVRGDIEHVNLATGERFQRVSGDGESRLVSMRQAEKLLERCIRDEMDRRPAVPVKSEELSPESYWIEEGMLASVESVMGLNRRRFLGKRKETKWPFEQR